MSANPESFLSEKAKVDDLAVEAFPNSKKIYIQGSRDDIRVPMREISQSPTLVGTIKEENPSIAVYDTSGPYTDPALDIDIRKGLNHLRKAWIGERSDTEALPQFSSAYGRQRMQSSELEQIRYEHTPLPRRARSGKNVSQMHYARQGMITPEMEYIAIRENQKLDSYKDQNLLQRHPGMGFGAEIPDVITPEFVRDEMYEEHGEVGWWGGGRRWWCISERGGRPRWVMLFVGRRLVRVVELSGKCGVGGLWFSARLEMGASAPFFNTTPFVSLFSRVGQLSRISSPGGLCLRARL